LSNGFNSVLAKRISRLILAFVVFCVDAQGLAFRLFQDHTSKPTTELCMLNFHAFFAEGGTGLLRFQNRSSQRPFGPRVIMFQS
jgi:hypothetical protein